MDSFSKTLRMECIDTLHAREQYYYGEVETVCTQAHMTNLKDRMQKMDIVDIFTRQITIQNGS